MTSVHTILFAGGGTGGHISPNLAIVERLHERKAPVYPHFVVSSRAVDAQVLLKEKLDFTPLPAVGLAVARPWTWWRFYKAYQAAVLRAAALIAQTQPAALIATGGFVSAPAVEAAKRAGVPTAMVNLDAVPGKANRLLARKVTETFTCYPCEELRHARRVGMPLPRSKVAPPEVTPGDARKQLGLDPDRPTILVTAGSQGALTVNQALADLTTRPRARHALQSWQVLHLTGGGAPERDAAQKAYDDARVPARCEAFCNAMGLAWRAATIAIARAGASSVAEVWANAVPTLFMPYPFHRDQHQRLNAQPLVDHGAAIIVTDAIDPVQNATALMGPLLALMSNDAHRQAMTDRLKLQRPDDGADAVAQWVCNLIHHPFAGTPRALA